jgi:hypothetical protein
MWIRALNLKRDKALCMVLPLSDVVPIHRQAAVDTAKVTAGRARDRE